MLVVRSVICIPMTSDATDTTGYNSFWYCFWIHGRIKNCYTNLSWFEIKKFNSWRHVIASILSSSLDGSLMFETMF
jgi:hypothetical protein